MRCIMMNTAQSIEIEVLSLEARSLMEGDRIWVSAYRRGRAFQPGYWSEPVHSVELSEVVRTEATGHRTKTIKGRIVHAKAGKMYFYYNDKEGITVQRSK
jgi:hypothetical protein